MRASLEETSEIEDLTIQNEGLSFLILEKDKIAENIQNLRSLLPENGRLMAMIKAYGYGQDDAVLSLTLKNFGIDIFGVAHPEEGLKLRKLGFKEDIFVIHAMPCQARRVVEADLQVAVSSLELIEALELESVKQGKIAKVHLHINTGMNRFGANTREALILGKKIDDSSFLKFEGLMTHLATADDEEQDPYTLKQMRALGAVHDALARHGINPPWIHGANSAGLQRHRAHNFNMARVGLSLFGVPNKLEFKGRAALKPAISLVSKVMHIHECTQGETVGYNRDYLVKNSHEKIGVIACGYHDGVPRAVSGKGYVLVRGQKAPYVGKVCMDYMMVDLSGVEGARIGDEATIFGGENGPAVELFSLWADTIPHEILCRISSRVSRVYI